MPSRLIGYARQSAGVLEVDDQVALLDNAGCERVYVDVPHRYDRRPEWVNLVEIVAADDVVMVWRLDRLGRTTEHLLSVIDELGSRGVGLRSLEDAIDTDAKSSALFATVATLRRVDRDLADELRLSKLVRTRIKSTPVRKLDPAKIAAIQRLYESGAGVEEILERFGITTSSLYRVLDPATRRRASS